MEQISQPAATDPGPQMLVRIFSFGPLTLHWYDAHTGSMKPFPEDRLHGKGAAH